MPLFSRRKPLDVQSFLVKIVNNNCPELREMFEGPRSEGRVPVVLVALVVPVDKGRPALGQAFAATTKELSSNGVALVVSEARAVDEVFVGLRWEGEVKFMRGKARHMNPMGCGFYQLGLSLEEVVPLGDYPELKDLHF
jgi:hypothetical protein